MSTTETDPLAGYDAEELSTAIDILAEAIDNKTDTTEACRRALVFVTGHLAAADLQDALLDLLTDLAGHLRQVDAAPKEESPARAYRRLLKLAETDLSGHAEHFLAVAAEYRLGFFAGPTA